MSTVNVEVTRNNGFDALITARERLRSLVLEANPEASTWGGVRQRSIERMDGNTRVDRTLALALLGIHDQIEVALDGWITESRQWGDEATPAIPAVSLCPVCGWKPEDQAL